MRTVMCVFLFTFLCLACEKEIDLKLNTAEPVIVIEGTIRESETAYVELTKTGDFNGLNTFPKVTGATITLSDDSGNLETLTETEPGIYETTSITGVPGRVYNLSVISEGEVYTSVSKMPYPTKIDTVTIVETTRWGETTKGVKIHFQDSVGIANYYRFTLVRNGEPHTSIFILEDNLYDGDQMEYEIAQASEPLEDGDNVNISMLCIDEDVYNYFLTIPSNWEPPANPANPTSNISNGALGYFSAETIDEEGFVVQ